MRNLIWFVWAMFAFSSIVLAQADDPGCHLAAGTKDETCAGTLTCDYASGFASTSFTVVCFGTYTIKAWTDCGESNCEHCASCVAIYTSAGSYVADCTNSAVCSETCCKVCQLQLSPGSYEIRVQLRACSEVDVEAYCEELSCKAYGNIVSGIASCP
ncbi:hypothetical protein KJZ99_05310 [bacterium]|nr:hypothetical protein [bacterium]